MIPTDIRAALDGLVRSEALRDEAAFAARAAARDTIEVHVLDRIEALLAAGASTELLALRDVALGLVKQLEAADRRLFRRLRADVRGGRLSGPALAELIDQCDGGDAAEGYDARDEFVARLIRAARPPAGARPRDAEMVGYQPAPARVILELVRRAGIGAADTLIDIGAGHGRVAILAHLLSGAAARGVEIEPSYVAYARRCAAALRLARVSFVCDDARRADLSDGTVFFLYTPFRGQMLAHVLERLREVARRRPIRIGAYGPCAPQVAREPWLAGDAPGDGGLAAFASR